MNYPDNMFYDINDERNPDYIEPPLCGLCGEELHLDVEADEDGSYKISYCLTCD